MGVGLDTGSDICEVHLLPDTAGARVSDMSSYDEVKLISVGYSSLRTKSLRIAPLFCISTES
jgi:hypothetical protein